MTIDGALIADAAGSGLLSSADTYMLRVMVVDEDDERRASLRRCLLAAGHRVIGEAQSTLNLAKQVAESQPDIIIIDTESPDRDTIEHICVITQDAPRPIVMFCADGDSARIREAVQSGVSAYIVGGLSEDRVQPVLDLAIAQFEALQSLRRELETAQTRLGARKRIDQAKRILMQRRQLSEPDAFRLLRKAAMDENLKLADMAEQVIRAEKLL